MAATTVQAAPAARGFLARPIAPSGLWSWLTTIDHKRIGILYGSSAFFFFLVAGLEALLMRTQLARPDATLVTPGQDRKSTRLNSSHIQKSRMPSSA